MKIFHRPQSTKCPWCSAFAARVAHDEVSKATRYECANVRCPKDGVMVWDDNRGWVWYGKKFAPKQGQA